MVFNKSAEIYFEKFHFTIKAKEFVVLQVFKIAMLVYLDYFIIYDYKIYPPDGNSNISPNMLSYVWGLKGMKPAPV